jgi:hypothetical protein
MLARSSLNGLIAAASDTSWKNPRSLLVSCIFAIVHLFLNIDMQILYIEQAFYVNGIFLFIQSVLRDFG